MFNKHRYGVNTKEYEEMYLELGISCISWISVELSLGFEKGDLYKEIHRNMLRISLMSEILSNLH